MTVRELISQLQEMPPGAEVWILTGGHADVVAHVRLDTGNDVDLVGEQQ